MALVCRGLERWGLGVAVTAGLAAPVWAGGIYASPHGARPLGRGGAFVAGADDLNGVYYNPAGAAAVDRRLADKSKAWRVFFDVGMVFQRVTYTRDENGIARPAIHSDDGLIGAAPPAIPQLAFAKTLKPFSFGQLTLGFGLWIPYTGLLRYPEPSYATEDDLARVPDVAPQRYQLLGLHEGSLLRSTALVVLNPVAALSLLDDRLQVGLGPQLMLVYFRSRLMLSGCPQVMCRPEQPDYDALAVAQAFALAPSLNLGILGRPLPWLRLGLSFQLPFFVRSAKATIDTRLPSNEIFNNASVRGRDAALSMNLPPILRAGAEFSLLADRVRIELAYTAEFWSVQRELAVVPDQVYIDNLPGIGSYQLGPVTLRRDMQTTHAVHVGGEAIVWKRLGARLGGMFESNSMPDATVSVLSPDNHKGLVALGLFLQPLHVLGADWRLDLSYGHIVQASRTVSPQDSQLAPVNPIRPDAVFPTGIGGVAAGTYDVSYDLIAFGFTAVR